MRLSTPCAVGQGGEQGPKGPSRSRVVVCSLICLCSLPDHSLRHTPVPCSVSVRLCFHKQCKDTLRGCLQEKVMPGYVGNGQRGTAHVLFFIHQTVMGRMNSACDSRPQDCQGMTPHFHEVLGKTKSEDFNLGWICRKSKLLDSVFSQVHTF